MLQAFEAHQTDAELVAAFQSGDAAAFDAIYKRYYDLLTVYIWRRCGNWHLAEEMVQEAMLNAWKYIPHGRIFNLNGYLILLVREIWWMRADQLRRRPETDPFDPHAAYDRYIDSVERRVCERETIREIETLLDFLPDDERTVARLKLLYGYDLPSAAQALGRGRTSVSAAWRRCSRKFVAWAGTKAHHEALYQALTLAQYPDDIPIESRCKVPGCARPRHAYARCQYHAEHMLARRRQLATKQQCTASTSA